MTSQPRPVSKTSHLYYFETGRSIDKKSNCLQTAKKKKFAVLVIQINVGLYEDLDFDNLNVCVVCVHVYKQQFGMLSLICVFNCTQTRY